MARTEDPTTLKWLVGAAAAFYLLLIIVPYGIFLSLDAFEVSGADGKAAVKIRQRDFWEIVYFVTNAFLVIVATVALIFAFRQSIAAHRQSDAAYRQNEAANRQNEMALRNAQAQVYLSMETKFTSQELVESRRMIVALRVKLTPLITDDKPLGALVNEELQALLTAKDGSKLEEYVKYIRLLTFIESIGLMARREYVSLDDIYYLLEPILLGFDRMFMEHIRARQTEAASRGNANSDRIYEHTIWLVQKMKNYEPTNPLTP